MRLIDANELKKAIEQIREDYVNDNFFWIKLFNIIDNAPTVELFCSYLSDGEVRQPCVEGPCKHERPQGEWIALKLPITEEEGDIKIICSNCKDEFIGQNDLETWIKVYHYCPNCGAYMKGGEEK